MKGLRKLGFYSAFILPALLMAGFYIGGIGLAFIHVFVFLLIPLMDYAIGRDIENLEKHEIPSATKEYFYRLVTFLWVYVQLAVLIWGFYVVTFYNLSVGEWLWFTSGMALVTGGIGITVAHELGHKSEKLEQTYSKILLMTVCYMHFFIEHNRGHHVRVATPEDPATSRKGESFYSFWWRSVKDGYFSAWELEKQRLSKLGLSLWSAKNQMILFVLAPLLFVSVFTVIFSVIAGRFVWEIPVFFAGQSVLGFTLLELVNYIEHYGMERKILPNGRYEKVSPLHSWNASQMVSNFFLFQLQRHSDHHAFAFKRYQVLDHHEDSPQLPQGYSAMIILAMFPPLWFRIMDPKLEQWKRKSKV
ncbi:alkane 1-monooxygenase [Arthrospiribacter ruber]|uniref:Alkane 1-monooxygenase n=1 Tax=Arthrospiribacter ruber TaxID=2487934 RepID=A0A951MBB0_9BACT|nr:alkane 1-monooxygenase [Arthrospiribacter ruber]MBW3467124.1 alkane 1-monooxygenase [Arthrospiribacter ruber]